MRTLCAITVACLVVVFAGCCATTSTVYHDVNVDYDVNADFSRLKTYQWVALPATLRIDEFNRSRIREYVNSELETRGYKITANNPDMYIVMFGGSYKAVDMTALMDYEVYMVGRLKLAIFDAASNREIWWGETKADLFHDMTPQEKDTVAKTAVSKILEHYPPQR